MVPGQPPYSGEPEMAYAIKYYRDQETADRYEKFGNLRKPAGYQLGRSRFHERDDAHTEACHINSCGPEVPAVIVTI